VNQQRSDWLAAMPVEAQLFAPKPGQESRTAFLAKLSEITQSGSEGGRLKAPFGPQFDATRVSEAAGQRTDGAAKVEQRQFEMSVTFASVLHIEQNGTRCCFVD
jgi:hypothetical protein